MSPDYTAVMGFGIDLGFARPEAIFGQGSQVDGYDDVIPDGYDLPVVLVKHSYWDYSLENGKSFLCVTGSVLEVNLEEVEEPDFAVDNVNVDRFIEWCARSGLGEVKPRWLLTCNLW